jgi:hypothetical protein
MGFQGKLTRISHRVAPMPVAQALAPNATYLAESKLSAQMVGQPTLAAAGFQPASGGHEDSPISQRSRLKGVPREDSGQDCPPHNLCENFVRTLRPTLGRDAVSRAKRGPGGVPAPQARVPAPHPILAGDPATGS